jgi:hypothetical protein
MALTGAGLNSMRSIPTFGTIGAIAEIVDNSIQWKNSNDVDINIIFIQKGNNLEEILIIDNGKGMGRDSRKREIIDYCLLFGGGVNHGATQGLGKYGIGLPFASCSQSQNYHVFTWQEKDKIKHVSRNHDDFTSDDPVIDKPHTVLEKFPKYFTDYLPELNSYKSGTIVHWKECDNLTYKRANTIIKHLDHKLGRIYRHYIGNGVKIHFKAFNQPEGNSPVRIPDLCREIKKFDPLFLDNGTIAPIPHNSKPSSELFGSVDTHVFQDSNGTKHEFTITASLAKKEIQLPNCKAGGNTPIGKLYGDVQGISLVRAKRELRLHHFDFDMPNGASDPRHRWWKIEVQFEPVSDYLLGVNANKTDAQHFRYISDQDQEDQDVDYIKLRYELSAKIQNLIKELWKIILERVQECKELKNKKIQICPKCQNRTLINGKCEHSGCETVYETCQIKGHENIKLVEGRCPACDNLETPDICPIHNETLNENGRCSECEETLPLTEEEKEELLMILESYREFGNDRDSVKSLIEWFAKSNKKHFVIFVSNPANTTSFFDLKTLPGKFEIILVNKAHPYYKSHIGPLRDLVHAGVEFEETNGIEYDIEEALESLILFIITWAYTEKASTSDQSKIERFRQRFGINLNEVLDIWKYIGVN